MYWSKKDANSEDEYCPYDLTGDESVFGLSRTFADTKFGKLLVVHSPCVEAEVCTLLIHGVGGSWTTWTPLLEAWHSNHALHDLVLVDLPGFGESENRLGHLRSEIVGKELTEVVRSFGYKKARIIGHSMGGFLTLDMAANDQEFIESIHVIAGAYFSIVDTVQSPLRSLYKHFKTSFLFGVLTLLAAGGPISKTSMSTLYDVGLLRPFLSSFAVDPYKLKPGVVESFARDFRPHAFLMAAQNGKNYNPDKLWGQIKCPVTATFALEDSLVPPGDAERLRLCNPSAHIQMVPSSSHMVHVERPRVDYFTTQ